MAEYTVYNTSGSKIYEIKENGIDTTQCPVWFVGHGMPDYGEAQNTNFLRLLENYCYSEEPNPPVKGQLWFKQIIDSSTGQVTPLYELRVCKNPDAPNIDDRWDKLPHFATSSDGSAPSNPQDGDMWYDFNTHSLKVYDEGNWVIIGPTDAEHFEHYFESRTINQVNSVARYNIPNSFFARDIYNDGDNFPSNPQGSLNLVTVNVLVKEIYDGTGLADNVRSHVSQHKAVVQATKIGLSETTISYNVDLIGAPVSEILAKSDNFDFNIQLYISPNTHDLTIQVEPTTSGSLASQAHCVVGFDIDVSRV